MSSSMASLSSRSARMLYEEPTRLHGPRSTGGSVSSSAREEMLMGYGSERERLRSYDRPQRAAASPTDPFSTSSSSHGKSSGTPSSLSAPRRPSASAYSDQGEASRDEEYRRLRKEEEHLRAHGGADRDQDRDGDQRRLAPPGRVRSRENAHSMPRSVSGPTSIGCTKVQKMVGDLEAAATHTDPRPPGSLRPPADTLATSPPVVAVRPAGAVHGPGSESAKMLDPSADPSSAGLPRSRSAISGTATATKGSDRAPTSPSSAAAFLNLAGRSTSASSVASSAGAGAASSAKPALPSLSSSSSSAKPSVAQTRPSLCARLFGFKSSKSAASSGSCSGSGSSSTAPSLHGGGNGGGSRETVGAAAVASPLLRSSGLLSPTLSSHELHGSDWSDSASIAHSVRSDSHAAFSSAPPRRSASVSSVTGRTRAGNELSIERSSTGRNNNINNSSSSSSGSANGCNIGSNGSLPGRVTASRVQAASLRQKVSSSSLQKSVRSPSPSPSVSTTSSSLHHMRSDTGDSAYKQAAGRRGARYGLQTPSEEATPAVEPGHTPADPAPPSAQEEGERLGFLQQSPPAVTKPPLYLDLGLHDGRRQSRRDRDVDDEESLSSRSSATPNYPTDQSFLSLSSASSKAGARKGEAAASSHAGTTAGVASIGERDDQRTKREAADEAPGSPSGLRKWTGLLRNSPTPAPVPMPPPPTRTPPPVPPKSAEPDDGIEASSSSATLQPATGRERSASGSPGTPSASLEPFAPFQPSAVAANSSRLDVSPPHGQGHGGRTRSWDDRSVTPTAHPAPESTMRLAELQFGEAFAAAAELAVHKDRRSSALYDGAAQLASAESLSRRRRRREEGSRDASGGEGGGVSLEQSNGSSEGSLSGPSFYTPRSSSLHGHGSSSNVDAIPSVAQQSARPSNHRGLSHSLIHSSNTLSSPLYFGGSHTITRGSVAPGPPQILPRTTSSLAVATSLSSTNARPESSHGSSPRSPTGSARQAMRMSRPRIADVSQHHHGHSNSFSGLYDNPLAASTITEETPVGSPQAGGSGGGSMPATPLSTDDVHSLWRDWHASIGASPLSPGAQHVSLPLVGSDGAQRQHEPLRPGLPPKNPLRNQRSPTMLPRPDSSRSVSDPVFGGSGGGDNAQRQHPFAFVSPGLAAETSESLTSAWQTQPQDGTPLLGGSADVHSELTVSPWADSLAAVQSTAQALGQGAGDLGAGIGSASRRQSTQLLAEVPYASQRRQSTNLGIGLGEDAGIPESLSAGALLTLSPQGSGAPWMSDEALAGEGRGGGSSSSSSERGVTLVDDPAKLGPARSGMTHSSSKRSKLMLSSAFRTGRNRSKTVDTSNNGNNASSNDSGGAQDRRATRKEGGTGSKIWSFAKELGGGDHDNELANGPGSLRKSRTGTKKQKGELVRPQIRRVFDDEHLRDGRQLEAGSTQPLHGHALAEETNRSLDAPSLGSPTTGTTLADLRSASIGGGGGGSRVEIGSPGPSTGTGAGGGGRAGGWVVNREHLDVDQKRVVKRWYVLRELLETERSYASDLAVARDVYLARARALAGIVVASNPASPLSFSSFDFFQPFAAYTPASSRPQLQQQSQPLPSLPPQTQTQTPAQAQAQQAQPRTHPQRVPQSLDQPPLIIHPSPQSQSHFQSQSQSPAAKHLLRHASADSNPHALGGVIAMAHTSTSPASLTSSNPSNRSSTYTVSSLSSQTSDGTSHPLPPLPPGISGGMRSGHGPPPMSPSLSAAAQARLPVANGSGTTSAASTTAGGAGSGMIRRPSQSSASLGSGASVPSAASTPTSLFPAQLPGTIVSSSSAGAATPDAPLSAADVRIIFAQLEQCAALADEVMAILEVAVGSRCTLSAEDANNLLTEQRVEERNEDDRVGDAFLRLMPRIDQVFAAYCSRHEASMSRLQELSSTEPKVAAFLRDCTAVARKHTNAWDLSSLLIKPVQRVLKYPLLIQEILSSTSEKHPDHASLRSAFAEIQKVADHINEVKKRKDLVDQIVTGKAARRSASQKVQHGTIKKIKRQQEKLRNAVVGPPPNIVAEDEDAYRALVEQLLRLEAGLEQLPLLCLEWCENLRQCYVAQVSLLERWRQVYLLDGEGVDEADPPESPSTAAEERLAALLTVLRERLVDEAWVQLDGEIRSSIVPMAERIGRMFANPKAVVVKRNDREPDYTRYRNEMLKASSKAPDRKLAESAGAFVAIHTQLMDELPQFNYGVQSLVDICVESLARIQAAHHLRVQKALIAFWREHSWSDRAGDDEIRIDPRTREPSIRHLNPVKLFWEVHSNISAYAEGLQIVSRRRHEDIGALVAPNPSFESGAVSVSSDCRSDHLLGSPALISTATLHGPSSPLASSTRRSLVIEAAAPPGPAAASPRTAKVAIPTPAPAAPTAPGVVPSKLDKVLSGPHEVLTTIAAVADSPARPHEAEANSLWGYPLLDYVTGDLFRVLYIDADDRRFYFSKTERGEIGWAERGAFVPLV